LAGKNAADMDVAYFYSETSNTWQILQDPDSKTIIYDKERCGGYPAVKHFNHPTRPNHHYLVIIGGCNKDLKILSKNVNIFLVNIEKLDKAEDVSMKVLINFPQKPLINNGDYFP
jgi:hypothetical protein